jgi:RNA polymerase sigma-70 factor (ECF subfamily)
MRDPGEEDDALVQAALEGDREAFALIYHRYKPDVWNLAYLMLRNHQEAEDSLQETFVKALRALASHRHVDAVRPWLLAICRNVCLDQLRSGRRRRLVSIEEDGIGELHARPGEDDRRLDFHHAIAQLSPADREAFMLVDVLGYRSHEAAAILGIAAPSTLRSRLARARRELAPAVSETSAEPPAEIWGVYHDPPDSAIVASFPATADTAMTTLAAAVATAATGATGATWATEATEATGATGTTQTATATRRNRLELVDFFDSLDGRIPPKLRVMAVIDSGLTRGHGRAQHWLADHPRWQVRRSGSHAGWLLEVESLLKVTGAERSRGALAALDAPTPFLWTQSQ